MSLDRQLLNRVSGWFDSHRDEMLGDLETLVRIPSVAQEDLSPDDKNSLPFGRPCREALDTALELGRKHGFAVENYNYYVGRIGLAEQHLDRTIGFWNHLDVVPAGNGWTRDPFDPWISRGFMIGRGSQDNKGPAVGNLYLMQCIRELGIPMKHELCLFVGCDEEKSMNDLGYYTAHFKTPMLSIVVDSGFPVCYGEKGILSGEFTPVRPFSSDILDVSGGMAENMIPDRAVCRLRYSKELLNRLQDALGRRQAGQQAGDMTGAASGCGDGDHEPEAGEVRILAEEDAITVTGYGTSRHSAFPEGSVNAIWVLSDFLAGSGCLEKEDEKLFRFLAETTASYYGEPEGVDYQDEVSGRTTCAGTVISTENGKFHLVLNIRYAITHDREALEKGLSDYAKSRGAVWSTMHGSDPHYFPKEHPAVGFLTDLYNEWSGEKTEPFVMGGGTYARKLPMAFAYGIGGMRKTKEDLEAEKALFRPGTGGAHEPDEGFNLRMYLEAMKFLTTAVVQLDRILE